MIYLSKMVIFHSYVTFPEGKFEVGQVVAFSTTLRSTHFMARHAPRSHPVLITELLN